MASCRGRNHVEARETERMVKVRQTQTEGEHSLENSRPDGAFVSTRDWRAWAGRWVLQSPDTDCPSRN